MNCSLCDQPIEPGKHTCLWTQNEDEGSLKFQFICPSCDERLKKAGIIVDIKDMEK